MITKKIRTGINYWKEKNNRKKIWFFKKIKLAKSLAKLVNKRKKKSEKETTNVKKKTGDIITDSVEIKRVNKEIQQISL